MVQISKREPSETSEDHLKDWNSTCLYVLYKLLHSWYHYINKLDRIWLYIYSTDQVDSQWITEEYSITEEDCSFLGAEYWVCSLTSICCVNSHAKIWCFSNILRIIQLKSKQTWLYPNQISVIWYYGSLKMAVYTNTAFHCFQFSHF